MHVPISLPNEISVSPLFVFSFDSSVQSKISYITKCLIIIFVNCNLFGSLSLWNDASSNCGKKRPPAIDGSCGCIKQVVAYSR